MVAYTVVWLALVCVVIVWEVAKAARKIGYGGEGPRDREAIEAENAKLKEDLVRLEDATRDWDMSIFIAIWELRKLIEKHPGKLGLDELVAEAVKEIGRLRNDLDEAVKACHAWQAGLQAANKSAITDERALMEEITRLRNTLRRSRVADEAICIEYEQLLGRRNRQLVRIHQAYRETEAARKERA